MLALRLDAPMHRHTSVLHAAGHTARLFMGRTDAQVAQQLMRQCLCTSPRSRVYRQAPALSSPESPSGVQRTACWNRS